MTLAELTEPMQKLLDGPHLAHFVTLMKDGSPQVTPVWVDHDGTHVIINTGDGRTKPRNIRRDPRVAISVVDTNSPYHYLLVRGKVVDVSGGEEAWQHIRKLSEKYTGNIEYPRREGDVRLIYQGAARAPVVPGFPITASKSTFSMP